MRDPHDYSYVDEYTFRVDIIGEVEIQYILRTAYNSNNNNNNNIPTLYDESKSALLAMVKLVVRNHWCVALPTNYS